MSMSKRKNTNDQIDTPEEEILTEEIVSEEYEGDFQSKLKKLKDEIKSLKLEKQEYLQGWQSARAELVNAKKRMETEQRERQSFANARLLEDLLPVADSFSMAMSNTEAWQSVDQGWRTGVEYIYSQLQKVLTEYGLEVIVAVDQQFDPRLHEAVEFLETEDKDKDNLVREVKQTGYLLGGRVIRPAKVSVYTQTSSEE